METVIWIILGGGILYLVVRLSLYLLFRRERYK
jgi:hypothetical protein